MFKNMSVFRCNLDPSTELRTFINALKTQAFRPCESLELTSTGWVPPVAGGGLVHVVGKDLFLSLMTERKLLPQSVINEVARERCKEIQEQQGFAPGRKQMREIKECIVDELLPRAFSTKSVTRVWLDPVDGWLVVDSASPARVDEVVRYLIKSLSDFPGASLRVERSPLTAMTGWLMHDTDGLPFSFTIDQDAELRATGQAKATVSYKRHTLYGEDMQRHIGAGKQCTRLAMTWADRISFVLTEDLTLKRIEALDVLHEGRDDTADAQERRDGDLALMAGEFRKLLVDLVDALGGEVA